MSERFDENNVVFSKKVNEVRKLKEKVEARINVKCGKLLKLLPHIVIFTPTSDNRRFPLTYNTFLSSSSMTSRAGNSPDMMENLQIMLAIDQGKPA